MLDLDLLMRLARNAAMQMVKGRTSISNQVEDITQELITHVLENPKDFNRYLHKDSPMGTKERENKLFVSLCRHANKAFREEMTFRHQERQAIHLDEKYGYDNYLSTPRDGWLYGLPYSPSYRSISEEEALRLLAYILTDDTSIPSHLTERVATVRTVVMDCTPSQKAVLTRMAMGKDFEQIGEDLGISKYSAKKRYQRARIHEKADVFLMVSNRSRTVPA